jgi:hypothetical protein
MVAQATIDASTSDDEVVSLLMPRQLATPVRATAHSNWPWVLFGPGLALVATGLVLYGVSYASVDDVYQRCAPHCTQQDPLVLDLKTKVFTSYGLLAVGGAATVAASLWLIIDRRPTRRAAGAHALARY